MLYFVYILYSTRIDRYYTGYCEDISRRLEKHNFRSTNSTKSGIPWKLVYTEQYETKTEAIIRENQIKKMKSRKFIEDLIQKSGNQNKTLKG
jgi:putative endonuclease